MARHNIQFKGIRHSPSDITGQDGDLLECVNLIHDGGELKPIEMPEQTAIRGKYTNQTLVAVHNLTDGKKYVFAVWNGATTTITIKDEGNNEILNRGIQDQIQWAETVGNTLVVGTDKSTYYLLYKNGAYKWLGDKLPKPVFDVNMGWKEGSTIEQTEYEPNPPCKDLNGDYIDGGGIPLDFQNDLAANPGSHYTKLENDDRENKQAIRDNFKAKMEKLIHDSKENNRFIFPFFVRYALRLYDNTYVMHSAPLLMLPSTTRCPILALVTVFDDKTVDTTAWYQSGQNDHHMGVGNIGVKIFSRGLCFRNYGFCDSDNNSMTAAQVSEWSDIIKGVDIFLSSQVQTYNPDYYDNLDNLPVRYYHNPISHDYGTAFFSTSKKDWFSDYFDSHINLDETKTMGSGSGQYGGDIYRIQILPVPQYSSENTMKKLKETDKFYRIKQYDLNSVLNAWSKYRFLHEEVDYGTLANLETYPVLPDDYISHNKIAGKVSYNYNQRLLFGNIRMKLPLWYQSREWEQDGWSYEMCFVIEKQDKTIYIRADRTDDHVAYYRFGHYLFYPDVDCKKAIVHLFKSGYDQGKYVIPMEEHPGLNGAFAIMPNLDCLYEDVWAVDSEGNYIFSPYTGAIPAQSSNEGRYFALQNNIAMSTVANPFHFPASNFKDIGRAKVLGIAANTLDVSSGQWGQYPLFVFCSDGIIAITIDSEGKFGGVNAVSADVLTEPQGLSQPTLVQMGQALVFLTQRGVMMISGTKVNCVSEAMNGRHFKTVKELSDVKLNLGAFASLVNLTGNDNTDFRDFAASGFLAFDYAHNRVLLLRPDKEYQYVLSLNTGLWSKQIIFTNLGSVQIENNNIVVVNEQPVADRSVAQRSGAPALQVKMIQAAVNNYTEMYLQGGNNDGYLYKTMEVMGENATKQLYQYGYFVSRPIRFGTDEYKTITRILHEYTHYAGNSFVKLALYGSRDGVKYGRINTLRGMSYKYFIFVVYTYMKPNERYSYMSVEFETRLTNKMR